MIRFEDWVPWYKKIVKTLGYDPKMDHKAAEILNNLLEGRNINLKEFEELISDKNVIIFGASPSLEKDIEKIIEKKLHKKFILIAADGAVSALLKVGIVPHVNVTDLDGKIEDILEANSKGTISVIHAHGDNIPAVMKAVPKFEGKIFGTTQTEPLPNVYNFGGFTDGDRCAFLADYFKAKTIILAGMEFGEYVGKYSKPDLKEHSLANSIKRTKMKFGEELLQWLKSRSRAKIVALSDFLK